jgi:hypothetical protein
MEWSPQCQKYFIVSHILTGEQLGFYGRQTIYHTDATDRNPFEVVIELEGTDVYCVILLANQKRKLMV